LARILFSFFIFRQPRISLQIFASFLSCFTFHFHFKPASC